MSLNTVASIHWGKLKVVVPEGDNDNGVSLD
jgi:hypothetical protein